MTGGPGRKRPRALICPACGGAVEQATAGGLPRFTCHLGHGFAAAEMDEAQARETERVLGVALRMFRERAELARRLAEAQRRRGRPVSAEAWAATAREMEEGADVPRGLLSRGRGPPGAEGDDEGGAGAA